MDSYRCPRRTMDHHRSDTQLPDYVQTVVVKDSKGLEKILLLPKALDLDRPKRSRTAFAKWQLDALETTFGSHPYLVGEQRTLLARRLGLSETQIKVWYQNRRTKQRKESHATGSGAEDEPGPFHRPPAAGQEDEVAAAAAGSSAAMQFEWPPSAQRHAALSADYLGQAFQHYYHPAMYQQLMQSCSSPSHHGAADPPASGRAIPTAGSRPTSGATVQPAAMSTERGHHAIHRVYSI